MVAGVYNPYEYDYDPYSPFDMDEYLYGRYGISGSAKKEQKNESQSAKYSKVSQTVVVKKKDLKIQNSLTKATDEAKVIFTETALTKIQTLVMLCDLEVGWHGIGKKLEKGKYLIEDILLYPQRTTGSSIHCDDGKYGQWFTNWLMSERGLESRICFHGHSHVNMATFSSATDRDLQDDIIEMLQENDFYVFFK